MFDLVAAVPFVELQSSVHEKPKFNVHRGSRGPPTSPRYETSMEVEMFSVWLHWKVSSVVIVLVSVVVFFSADANLDLFGVVFLRYV